MLDVCAVSVSWKSKLTQGHNLCARIEVRLYLSMQIALTFIKIDIRA